MVRSSGYHSIPATTFPQACILPLNPISVLVDGFTLLVGPVQEALLLTGDDCCSLDPAVGASVGLDVPHLPRAHEGECQGFVSCPVATKPSSTPRTGIARGE